MSIWLDLHVNYVIILQICCYLDNKSDFILQFIPHTLGYIVVNSLLIYSVRYNSYSYDIAVKGETHMRLQRMFPVYETATFGTTQEGNNQKHHLIMFIIQINKTKAEVIVSLIVFLFFFQRRSIIVFTQILVKNKQR